MRKRKGRSMHGVKPPHRKEDGVTDHMSEVSWRGGGVPMEKRAFRKEVRKGGRGTRKYSRD